MSMGIQFLMDFVYGNLSSYTKQIFVVFFIILMYTLHEMLYKLDIDGATAIIALIATLRTMVLIAPVAWTSGLAFACSAGISHYAKNVLTYIKESQKLNHSEE